MLVLQKHQLNSFYILGKLDIHNNIKELILNNIDNTTHETLDSINNSYADKITKLDWSQSKDLTRGWLDYIYKPLTNYIQLVAENTGFRSHSISDIWFQQYYNLDTHGWHTHSNNFTLVYYLELNESSPKTQLLDPYTLSKVIIPNITEGDVLLFPSYVIHRAPMINNSIRKTIISCNLDFIDPHPELITKLNILFD